MDTTEQKIEKAVLAYVSLDNREDIDFTMNELKGLCDTAGLRVVGKLVQKAKIITPATYIGSGKLEELCQLVHELDADLVVFNNELSGSQLNNISDEVGAKVIDRTTLILDIFAGRAKTSEGKLQVELAQLKYNLPRISGIVGTSGRFGSGGVGMRGPGEKKVELDKRVIEKDILKLEREIQNLKEKRGLRRKQRNTNAVKSVAIVGYTNAGKSTLLNVLSKADIYADDKLFATLDTTTRKLWLGPKKEFVITDTVGFIDKLPHAFVDAFASTLEEAREADLILHVIDSCDPYIETHREVVKNVLKQIGIESTPILTVYNKIDKLSSPLCLKENEIMISAKQNINIDLMKSMIELILWNE